MRTEHQPGPHRPRYCVIGAGAAGLAAMRALTVAGHEFDCFESTDRVGGHWHTDYDNLHLITPRDASGFSGNPMPSHWPDFPRRLQMVDYLEQYADRHALREQVTFGTRVEKLEPVGSGAIDGWYVSTSDGETQRYAGVLVANGHNSAPLVPRTEGTFEGKMLHSGEFKNASSVDGQRVLVVGSGNSGCDIASELAQTGHDVTLSMRRGHLFQPKSFFGKPRGSLKVMRLPPALQEPILRGMIRMAVGRPEAYGLPAPVVKSLSEQRPVVNTLVLHWIQHGRIEPKPGILRVDGFTVDFVDDTSGEFDTIVWATGFRPVVPFLPDKFVLRKNGVPLRVGGCILPYKGPARLYFVGLCAPRGPQLPVYSEQSEMIMDMLEVQEQHQVSLADRFSDTEAPEHRIDLVRTIWEHQMSSARNYLEKLASTSPTSTLSERDNAGSTQ